MNKPTPKEFLQAVKKNNYPKTMGHLFRFQNDVLTACALGQGLLNIGAITEESLRSRVRNNYGFPAGGEQEGYVLLNNWFSYGDGDLIGKVYRLNDSRNNYSVQEVADQVAENLGITLD